jgi:hypothetical protein
MERALVSHFWADRNQLVERVGQPDGPASQCRCKPGPFSFEIDDLIDRANGEKVLLCELPFGAVDNAERWSIP